MFDYNNAVIYSQTRKEVLLREARIAQLLTVPPQQKNLIASRLAAGVGNMLIALGTRLKAPYETTLESTEPSAIPYEIGYDGLNYQAQR